MRSLEARSQLDADVRVFRAKFADGSVKTFRTIWLGGVNSSMREEGTVCSWEAHGSIVRRVRRIDEGTHSLEMPEITMPVHREAFDLANSQSEKYNDCPGGYESDLESVSKMVNDSLQYTITSDVPTVKSLISALQNVVEVTGP